MSSEKEPGLLDQAYESVKSVTSEISDYTKNRFGHPLFFSFIFSFVFYNWRPISIFLFSKGDIEKIIEALSVYDNPGAVIVPAFGAAIYTILFPYIRNNVDEAVSPPKEIEEEKIHQRAILLAQRQAKLAEQEYIIATARSGTRRVESLQAVISQHETESEGLRNSVKILTGRFEKLNELREIEQAQYQQSLANDREQYQEELSRERSINSQNFSYKEVEKTINEFNNTNHGKPRELALLNLMTDAERNRIRIASSPEEIVEGLRDGILRLMVTFSYLEKTGSILENFKFGRNFTELQKIALTIKN